MYLTKQVRGMLEATLFNLYTRTKNAAAPLTMDDISNMSDDELIDAINSF